MQPFSNRDYIGGVSQAVMSWALAHSPSRGVWGHAPPELEFWKFIPIVLNPFHMQ